MRETRADWLPVAEARARITASVPRMPAESLPLREALGRVLAEEIVSPLDLPPWDNSAMDGFAVRAEDIAGATSAAPAVLRVVDDVPAGGRPAGEVGPGEAVRVMTGAPVPGGADTVVRVEHTDGGTRIGRADGRVSIRSDSDARRNIRRRGEELRSGAPILPYGRILRAAELGVAASVGRSQLRVRRAPVVGILTSGDELVEVDRFAEVLAGGRIVSSNGYVLAAQVEAAGAVPRLLGIARDTPESLREHVGAARGCDVLITSAGISMGEHDLVMETLGGLGLALDFWRVRMRPGSPMAFGRIAGLGGIPWFGLPGNPVSSAVTFELFVRPALLRMMGRTAVYPPTVRATLAGAAPDASGLTHFLRVRLSEGERGLVATPTGAQGSGMLTSMAAADALLVVPGEDPSEEAASRSQPNDGAVDGDGEREYAAILLGGAPLREEPGY